MPAMSTSHPRSLRPALTLSAAFGLLLLATPLTAQVTWTQLAPTTAPPARTKAQIAHSLVTGNYLLFGGIDPTQVYRNDTWTYDPLADAWTQENPTTMPPGRIQSDLVFDLLRNRFVMWSGYPGGNGYVQDLWEWVPGAGGPGQSGDWQQIQPAPGNVWPQERDHMAMVYDLARGRTLMFGGWNYFAGQLRYNDLWAWDGTNWTQITTTNTPAGRDGHDMVLDTARDQLVVFGGGRWNSVAIGETWTLDLASNTWTRRTPAQSPAARYNHTMAWDEARQRVVLFGGRTSTQSFADTWEWDGSNWAQRSPTTSPSARQYGKLAYDPLREQIVMFGGDLNGAFGQGALGDTWRYGPINRASWNAFGAGCRGSDPNATPLTLAGGTRPWLGDTAQLQLGALPAPTFALLAIGFSTTSSPLGPLPLDLTPFGLTLNCFLLVDPAATVGAVAAASTTTFGIPFPNNAALLGLVFHAQGSAAEPSGNLVISNGLTGTVGGR